MELPNSLIHLFRRHPSSHLGMLRSRFFSRATAQGLHFLFRLLPQQLLWRKNLQLLFLFLFPLPLLSIFILLKFFPFFKSFLSSILSSLQLFFNPKVFSSPSLLYNSEVGRHLGHLRLLGVDGGRARRRRQWRRGPNVRRSVGRRWRRGCSIGRLVGRSAGSEGMGSEHADLDFCSGGTS